MARLSIGNLQALAQSVGVPTDQVPTAAAIAMAESSGNPSAVGDLTLGVSVGLWQINIKAHPQYDQTDLLDPTYNAKAMLAVSHGGTNWGPWSTWWKDPVRRLGPGDGPYRQFLSPLAPSTPSTTKSSSLISCTGSLGSTSCGLTTAGALLLGGALVALSALGAVALRENGHQGFARAHEASERSMDVQSLLFSRARGWTSAKAKAWARSHGFLARKVDVTERYVRLRQADPSRFGTMRTVVFGQGIKAVVGR